jgi:hypothetical protein
LRSARFIEVYNSPELNPDEMLNQDVKRATLRQRRPKNFTLLKDDVRAY